MKLREFCADMDREHGKCRERSKEKPDPAFTAADIVVLVTFASLTVLCMLLCKVPKPVSITV